MTRMAFKSMIEFIRQTCGPNPDLLQYRLELVTRDAVEAGHHVGNYVDLERNFDLHDEYVRFRVLPEGSWVREITDLFVMLPYSSIGAVVEVIEKHETQKSRRFQLFVSAELRLHLV